MSFEYSNDIAEKILSYLEGWTIEIPPNNPPSEDNNGDDGEEDSTDEVQSFLTEEEISELNISKALSSEEVELFYTKAFYNVQAYLGTSFENVIPPNSDNDSDDPTGTEEIILENICQWAAGLLWKKYNVKPVESVDETPFTGYGDDLIYKSKKSLQSFRYRKLVFL